MKPLTSCWVRCSWGKGRNYGQSYVQHEVDGGTTSKHAPRWNNGAAASQLLRRATLIEDCGFAVGCKVVEEKGRMNDVGDVAVIGSALDDQN